MNITLSPAELFIIYGGFSAFILSLAFIFRIQRHNRAGFWLIGFCLANVYVIFVKILFVTGLIYEFPHFLRWKFPIGLCRPVFFFLFIIYLYGDFKKIRWQHLLHFIPVLIVMIYFMPFFFSPAIEKISWLKGEILIENASLPGWYFYFISVYSAGYLTAAMYIFLKNRHLTQKLLNIFISGICFGAFIFLIIAIINISSGRSAELNNLMHLVLASGFLLLSFLILASPTALKLGPNIKYQSSNIDQKRSLEIFAKAQRMLQQKKLYRDPELKLKDLAGQIKEPYYLLSHAINQQTSKSFNDFINQMRVEEAAHLISSGKNEHLSLEAIAYEVGFNSRSSFYSAFKKIKKNTPAAFKKALPA
jgi:AraC-like DNA-binding protein